MMDRGYVLHSYPHRETSLILQAGTEKHRRVGLVAEAVLRRFELRLLKEVGFALELSREAGSGAPIEAARDYWYVVERGPVAAGEGEPPHDAVKLCGLTLIDLERDRFEDAVTVAQSKQLMRLLIHHCLNGQELATRALVRDLQRLDEGI